ncbi:hypothetical protein LOZ39_000604 [Ophidiomyces ophidiicola]|nr:hypothetical protein LOZ50_000127 [Ophidiomyces ophidiicola]KAI2015931.1 hypothetical protein LOZ49_000327 [Ophidiomyces ophidiicola]KAI2057240.1 hypothetical protein LOZ44_001578 [Ophidiomyces ophidiicola]KAI2080883.1 hypothetical protein LOZ39_000604 [Ophidiomyces ophidiicola]KAI2144283.1 hypothetical protein LOZ28_001525 [Ophidiomyces ophidiicola]
MQDICDNQQDHGALGLDRQSPMPTQGMPILTKMKVMHCSYHYWHSIYRAISPKARLIALSSSFVQYLQADGIVLPPDDTQVATDDDSWVASGEYDDDEEGLPDPSEQWPEIHARVKATITELGGSVSPKLNWSAPRDATHMIPSNRLECKTANDVYLVLKSSSLIANDLDRAFEGCTPGSPVPPEAFSPCRSNGDNSTVSVTAQIPYHLVLRKYVNFNPALEFRCFVRSRRLICICQRTFKFYKWLHDMKEDVLQSIQQFFDKHLRDTFPDPDFTFDVYVPNGKVWLLDFSPFSERTEPLHFTWEEVLGMEMPDKGDSRTIPEEQTLRMRARRRGPQENGGNVDSHSRNESTPVEPPISSFRPTFVLAGNPDTEHVGLDLGTTTSASYSFINEDRVPRDVIDAAQTPGGTAELLASWKIALERDIQADQEYQSENENISSPKG